MQVAEEAARVAKRSTLGIATPEWGVLRGENRVSSCDKSAGNTKKRTVVLQFKHLMAESSAAPAPMGCGALLSLTALEASGVPS